MRRSPRSLEFIGAAPYPNLAARFKQKDALALRPLREHAGHESTGRRLFRLRKGASPANERCQPRLVARLQRLNEQDGRGSSGRRKLPDVDQSRVVSEIQSLPTAIAFYCLLRV